MKKNIRNELAAKDKRRPNGPFSGLPGALNMGVSNGLGNLEIVVVNAGLPW